MNRRGIALVLVLIAMLVTAALAAGVLIATSTQARASGDAQLTLRAGEAADRGQVLAATSWSPESSLTMPLGATNGPTTTLYADSTSSITWLTRLSRESFWVTSWGRGPLAPAAAPSPLPIQRRVGVLYRLHVPDVRLTAALSVRDSLLVSGAAVVDGRDAAPPGWGALCGPVTGAIAAAAAPDTTRICDGPCGAVTASHLIGSPLKLLDSAAALPSALAQLGSVTWTSLAAHATYVTASPTTVTPAPRLTGATHCDSAAVDNWGDPRRATPCRNRFVIVHARGDLVMDGGVGQGIILGEGDVELRNGAQFFGLILARDDLVALTGTGPSRIWGAAVASDRRRANGDVSVIAGTAAVTYSSCAVEMSLLATAPMRREVHRGWTAAH
ncbi:MAG: hypothetical protein ACREOG_17115 [Gemmatimonadaceae bacterium]